MPDSSNVIFSPGGHGQVIAVMSMPGQKHTTQYNLSTQQFAQFLDPGKDGQFDKMFDNGAPATLQRLANAQGGGTAEQGQQPQPGAQQPAKHAAPQDDNDVGPAQERLAKVKKEAADKAAGVRPGMSDEDASDQRRKSQRRAEIEEDARRLFPMLGGQAKQRNAYIAQQLDQDQKQANAVEVAGEQGKVKRDVASIQAGSRERSTQTMADAKVKSSQNYSEAKVKAAELAAQREDARLRAAGQRSNLHEQMATYRNKQQTGTKTTPAEDANYNQLVEQMSQQMSGAPQAPTPQAATPGKQAAAPPPPDQRVANQTKVTTAKGTFVWGADGHWHPAGQ